MSSPIGYNNPAYTHQFDASLYDYQYVPEIDPEFEVQPEHLIRQNYQEEFSGGSEEFDASDESNQSIIVEECNNRRITLICEKRSKTNERYYEDESSRGAYHHDISLESDDFTEESTVVTPRHQRRLDPPPETRNSTIQPRGQRQHRYEEISDEYKEVEKQSISRHRYAEILVGENGYPSIGSEIEIERNVNGYRIVTPDCAKKPRAPSPVSQRFSPVFGAGQTYQRTISPRPSLPVVQSNPAIEMAELSPFYSRNAAFFQSPKRQPPIGASTPVEHRESARKVARNTTPNKLEVFQVKPATPKGKVGTSENRRDLSSSFQEKTRTRSPYKSTTADNSKAKTAIITPILHRKSRGTDGSFQKLSHMFQSTGNLYKVEGPPVRTEDLGTKARIKRNQSVPNFVQSLANEREFKEQTRQKSVRRLEYQYSPAKSYRFSPISRSRISLIDQTKISWSNSGSDFHAPPSGCLLIGAVILIVTSIASCGIAFYLFSRLGRRYYLDFGIMAGFVNLILGVLGFRSQCWKWLPNRNYVSGYIVLTAFGVISCAGFVYLITARPMSGDPMLDLMGGGICGVSVLIIVLSITGLTMSGCCKSPPPDNRVNNI